MERSSINPGPWSLELGFSQGVLVSGAARTLYCSGQTSMTHAGEPIHAGDLDAQLSTSLDNLEAVLEQADMKLADVVRLVVYTPDVDLFVQSYASLRKRLQTAEALPAMTVIGVTRLLLPGQLVELEATAVA